jgi:hypothetical protein
MRVRPSVVAVVLGASLAGAGCGDKAPTFHKVDGAWHYRDVALRDVDAGSFAVLDAHHAKDARRVYYGDTSRDGKEYYSIAHARVRPVDGADPATFRVLRSGYAKDASSVFFEGVRFAVRDAPTFELLDYGFARDRFAGYYHQAEIPGSHGPSLAALDTHHARDRSHAWYATIETTGARSTVVARPVHDADAASFEMLGSGYARDRLRVYFRGGVVAQAQRDSFVVLSPPVDEADARDVRSRYRDGQRIGAATGDDAGKR